MQIKIIENSKKWVGLSVIFVVISVGIIFTKGLNLGIDFSGGSLFQVQFEQTVDMKEINANLNELAKTIPQFDGNARKVQLSEGQDVIIRIAEISQEQKEEFFTSLDKVGEYQITREEKVGASVGAELKTAALYSLVIGGILIVIYITLRFEFMFAVAAILALIHDISIAIAGIALLGYEVNTPFIAAILTILGYSINDTIVVFDRIRETLRRKSDKTFGELLDRSVNQVMTRSINTSITTLLAVVAVLLFGGDSLKTFITTLLIGILAGTYSSIFLATPLVYLLEKNRDGHVDPTKYLEDDGEQKEKILV